MFTNILIAVICMAAFFTSLWSYRRGLKDGLALNDNKHIEPIKTPVQVIHERTSAKEISEAEKAQAKFIENLFAYTGNTQEVVKDA